jgi:uncharacterized iron-regulated membrane protein
MLTGAVTNPWPFRTALALQIVGEWMLREHYDLAAVVAAVFTLSYAANLVREMLL